MRLVKSFRVFIFTAMMITLISSQAFGALLVVYNNSDRKMFINVGVLVVKSFDFNRMCWKGKPVDADTGYPFITVDAFSRKSWDPGSLLTYGFTIITVCKYDQAMPDKRGTQVPNPEKVWANCLPPLLEQNISVNWRYGDIYYRAKIECSGLDPNISCTVTGY